MDYFYEMKACLNKTEKLYPIANCLSKRDTCLNLDNHIEKTALNIRLYMLAHND